MIRRVYKYYSDAPFSKKSSDKLKMSLACTQCEKDMGPSDCLPGREGAIVHPVLTSFAFVPLKEGEPTYKTIYTPSPANLALCFECIENALPENRNDALKRVYASFEAETDFRRVENSQVGKFIGGLEGKKWQDSYQKFEESKKNLEKECIFCGNDVKNGKPFFIARTIDKAYSEQHITPFVTCNYSWSDMKEGTTSFKICFDDFRANFPKIFEYLGYMLLGEKNPNLKMKPGELYISPEFEAAMDTQGKSLDAFIDEQVKQGRLSNVRIIRRCKDSD